MSRNMSKISIYELKELSETLYFKMDDDQIKKLQVEFNDLLILLNEIAKIDVSKYEPTNFCINTSSNQLRPDLIENDFDGINHLDNSSNKKERYIVIK